jgi:MFS family permease
VPKLNADPQGRNLALLLVCQGVTTLGLMLLVPVMPLYISSLLQIDPQNDPVATMRWSSLALAAPGLGTLCCAPFAGRFCDRFGYRRILLGALIVFIASMLLMALSTGLAGFIVGRLLQGVSTIGVILTAFIGRISDDTVRGRNFGLQESAIAGGALLGPVLGGIMLDYWSLRPMLIGSALLTGLAGGILWSRTKEPAAPAANTNTTNEATGNDGNNKDKKIGLLSVMRHPDLRRWMLAACLVQAAGFAMLTVFALFIAARFPHLDAPGSVIGMLHALGWLATMVASPLWGHLNDRGDPRRNFLLAAGGCALSSAMAMATTQLWAIALLRLLQGACYAALIQSMLLTCLRQLPAADSGHITGLGRSFMVAGQLLGPLLVIAFAALVPPQHLLWLVALLFLGAALLVWRPAGSVPHSQRI